MTDRLDDIFSPQRLRRNWQARKGDNLKAYRPESGPQDSQNAEEIFDHLKSLIQQRFQAPPRDTLYVLLDELQDLIRTRFSPAHATQLAAGERARLESEIQTSLNDLEDLLEAFLL